MTNLRENVGYFVLDSLWVGVEQITWVVILHFHFIKNPTLSLFVWVLLFLFFVMIKIALWRNKTLTILENDLQYKSGLFSKNTSTIPIQSILSADITQKPKEKLLKMCKLSIDYGESTDTLIFILTQEKANEVREKLVVAPRKVEDDSPILTLDFLDILLLSLGKSSIIENIAVFGGLWFFVEKFELLHLFRENFPIYGLFFF